MPSTIAISPFTIDTNILIYSVDSSDPGKHRIADVIVRQALTNGIGIPFQCLSEFVYATTKKRILTMAAATDVVLRVLLAAKLVPSEEADLIEALRITTSDRIPFFDALLLATAARSGCTTLFSEDFQDGRTFGTLTVRNPFKLSAAGLTALLT